MLTLKRLYVWILILTAADIIMTIYGCAIGVFEEANPLLAYGIHNFPIITGIAVFVLATGAVAILHKYQNRVKWVTSTAIGILTIKIMIVVYEVFGLTILI